MTAFVPNDVLFTEFAFVENHEMQQSDVRKNFFYSYFVTDHVLDIC